MREVPAFLSRRYKALDELIQELNSYPPSNTHDECASTEEQPGIKVMCDFWDILKEDPDLNLTQAVHQRMRAKGICSGIFGSQNVSCYRSGPCCGRDKRNETPSKQNNMNQDNQRNKTCSSSKSATPSATTSQNNLPLNKVLCNLNEAASFEKKCQEKISKLLETQSQLQDQIQILEGREKESVKLMKQADCMWSCMEEAYKTKIAESLERQNGLLKQLKEVEESNGKWRKNKKDLDFQMNNINKCYQEIKEKINEKTSDIKCIELEIVNFKKHIECNKSDLEAAKKSFGTKKQASDAKMSSIAAEVTKLETSFNEEKKRKFLKEQEGTKYIKEAREELQKLCKVLLQKKIESEDLKAEKEALLLELNLLIQTCDHCKDKCKSKEKSVDEEIKSLKKEIAEFKVRCTQCHECIDTSDIRKFCTDCPRCLEERNCLNEGDHCNHDHAMDCVCMTVKQKFLDNVFDNMYTSLERQIQSKPGKAVAEEVMNCLKKSRNGKLNERTRKILQDFILTTVKKNLNLTIVGGAVKTRCEMDAETYNQLMLCLKQVKVIKPKKSDKGTEPKKEPCKRWGDSSECNCPKGPKACICTKRAPPPTAELSSCPPQQDPEDAGEVVICPHKDSTPCGPDCGMQGVPNAVGSEVAAWRPSPCEGPTCQFKNMRAAQCVLGPEKLTSARTLIGQSSISPTASLLDDQVTCKCSGMAKVPCDCPKDVRGHPRERIIEEVMGRYAEITPIEKVTSIRIKTAMNSKQMKVEIPKPCNKESCAKQIKCEDVDKIIIDDAPVRESLSKFIENQLMAIVQSDNNEMDDVTPIITKNSSGDLKLALDQNYIRIIDKNIQDNTNLFVELNKTNSGELLVSLHKEDSISNIKNKVLAKKTSSGNILLEFDKEVSKKCLPHLLELKNKVDTKIRDQSFIKDNEHKNLTKYFVDTIIEKSSECNIKNNQLFKVKVKGINDMGYDVFAIRKTDSGVYELILDKEFEKWYMQTIKEQHSENEDSYIYLVKTDSGHFLININGNDQVHSESQRAVLIKSNSGNIKVIVTQNNTENGKIRRKFGSVLSPQTLSSLWNKPSYASKEFHEGNLKKSQIIATKSSSDSNVYGRVKFDIQYNKNLIASEAVLKKTDSGQYTVVLDKESKNAFISNLKKTISSSSKGLIPIKRTDSGNIIVSLNTDLKNQYESLKITQSGKIYVIFKKKDTEQGKSTKTHIPTSQNIFNESKWPQHIDTTKTVITKATTTTCNRECKENSCDESKCICGGYASNVSFKENAEIFSNIEEYDSSTLYNEDSNNDSNSKEELIQNSPHIVIKPCGFNPVLEKIPIDDNYNVVQPTCPYHIGRYTGLSNEILEISGLCQRIDIDDNKKPVENNTVIKNKRKIDAWDSIELLPPQLPPFLKAYSLK